CIMSQTPPNSKSQHFRSLQSSTPLTKTSAKPPDSGARLQSELKREMKGELEDAVYQSPDPFEKTYPTLPPADILTIVEKLLNGKQPNDYLEDLGFPKKGLESRYYLPFSKLLNNVKTAMTTLGFTAGSVYANVEFEVYDREMADGTDNDAKLKPDIIARRKDTPETVLPASASWRQVELCVEVKSHWSELVAQANTYARCLFAFQRNRRFVPMIFFKQDAMEVKFGMYTTAWLCHSEPGLELRAESGFRDFVEQIARLFSCRNRWQAGFDRSINNGECYIQGHGVYNLKENICYRISARGRRTRVDIIQKSKNLSDVRQSESQYSVSPLFIS
ncbi:MAG TPA: hypothetical protein VGO47_09210, partial [Chlamydiales bacterium]|nr:hypothetical protein [Chlamydiales bacterium]